MKIKYKHLFSITLLSTFGFSCGHNSRKPTASLSQAADREYVSTHENHPEVAVLYFGGYTSCSTAKNMSYPNNVDPIAKPTDSFTISMARWLNGFDKSYPSPRRSLISCYPFWTNIRKDEVSPAPGSLRTHGLIASHVNPMESSIYIRHDLTGGMSPTVQINLGQFLSKIETLLASQNIKKVAIIGHSYGGYTALLVAKALSAPGSRTKVTHLTTLDPISMDTCQPQILVNHLVREAPAPGCNEAPATGTRDSFLSLDDLKKIAANIPWTNLWQGVDTYLHSSPIDIPGIENQEVIYNQQSKDGFANHFLFVFPSDKTNPTWPKVADKILKKIASTLE